MSQDAAGSPESRWKRRMALFGSTCNDLGLGDRFTRADEAAQRRQARHRLTTGVGAFCGTLAIVIGSTQLGKHYWKESANVSGRWAAEVLAFVSRGLVAMGHKAMLVEFGLIAVTLLCVFYGYYSHNHHEWLLSRYVAERYRSLPFTLLISPTLWRRTEPGVGELRSTIAHDLNELGEVHRDGLKDIAHTDEPPAIPRPEECERADPELTARLVPHYLERRLKPQIHYFRTALEKHKRRMFENPVFLPVVFLGSVFFVLLHLAFETAAEMMEDSPDRARTFEGLSGLMLLISVVIPVVWAGIRTWRAANEFSRNAARSHARLALLNHYARTLEAEPPQAAPDSFDVFRVLALTENLLRNEQQEWLRLMVEAEWY